MYACNCDGIDRDGPMDHGIEGDALRSHLTAIDRVTGHRPPTCPWNAFNEPIVQEVLAVRWSVEEGNLGVTLGPDPVHKVVQAIGVYTRALKAAKAEEEQAQRDDAKAKRDALNAARRANRG
mgnify:CR=1 FL=1